MKRDPIPADSEGIDLDNATAAVDTYLGLSAGTRRLHPILRDRYTIVGWLVIGSYVVPGEEHRARHERSVLAVDQPSGRIVRLWSPPALDHLDELGRRWSRVLSGGVVVHDPHPLPQEHPLRPMRR